MPGPPLIIPGPYSPIADCGPGEVPDVTSGNEVHAKMARPVMKIASTPHSVVAPWLFLFAHMPVRVTLVRRSSVPIGGLATGERFLTGPVNTLA
jgi:hypothetical protein